ncbi:hypothetical protein CMsap09_10825 [Clavibacter michiganensis]|uniref:Uncharacterized protein n=1 Tax=Clavibacter michiganensis TaxID=28447 RepID=A0A251XV96_9MICO|nr:hypothetical protein CMsap09_10825 [Clavibacter michiganensis]
MTSGAGPRIRADAADPVAGDRHATGAAGTAPGTGPADAAEDAS